MLNEACFMTLAWSFFYNTWKMLKPLDKVTLKISSTYKSLMWWTSLEIRLKSIISHVKIHDTPPQIIYRSTYENSDNVFLSPFIFTDKKFSC